MGERIEGMRAMADFADFNAPLGQERAHDLVAQARRAEPDAVLEVG